jgi:hypothetical protein
MAPAIASRALPKCEVLANGDVVLRLDDVCIQTAAKRARSDLLAGYLDEPEAEAEKTIGVLECFLETSDFRSMRSRHPELAGGTQCCVRLHQCQDGTVTWEVYGVP